MEIRRIVSAMLQSNMYIIIDGNEALIIDPSGEVELDVDICSLVMLLTHEHYDHICAVNYWKNKYYGLVICSKICAENIEDPRKNCARYFEDFTKLQSWIVKPEITNINEDYTCVADYTLNDHEIIKWRNHTIETFYMPGHSQGGMGYLMDNKWFFSGDNILPGYSTELRLPGGCKADWITITKPALDKFDDKIIILPGHFDPLTFQKWRITLRGIQEI